MDYASLAPLGDILASVAEQKRFALAYSGGLDSRFLAHAAHALGFSPLLLHVTGPHVPPEETAFARSWAESLSLEFREIPVNPLGLPSVAEGSRERCYACKKAMFTTLAAVSDLPLCDGTNASDTLVFRPGLRAVRELGVASPLALAAVAAGEHVVRRMLAEAGMPEADFRLRLVSKDRPELHMLAADVCAMPPELEPRLLQAVHAAMPGYHAPVLSAQETLSGFFDRPSA